ncbi:hypothetical protein [Pseudonocardia sp. H11422]|uniref:hypothetical protein n=1 Tax=Pseudonocardia sp. H11422 TaxID=2835866 RepID=UPI001BDBBB91|nr:hypothetical protein [Pseudonocardia sp. H11422]
MPGSIFPRRSRAETAAVSLLASRVLSTARCLVCEPDVRLAGRTLRRLFPWAPTDGRSWPTLRWANGRAPLRERPRLSERFWHCAPLEEWDGRTPEFLAR